MAETKTCFPQRLLACGERKGKADRSQTRDHLVDSEIEHVLKQGAHACVTRRGCPVLLGVLCAPSQCSPGAERQERERLQEHSVGSVKLSHRAGKRHRVTEGEAQQRHTRAPASPALLLTGLVFK